MNDDRHHPGQMMFDPDTGETRLADALSRVDEHAHEEWKVRALEAVQAVARTHLQFTTDDTIAYMAARWPGVSTHEGRAWGAIMRRAAKEGWCYGTASYRPSEIASRHRGPKRIWASKIYLSTGDTGLKRYEWTR